MEYKASVFIGRFQPPHKAHIEVIEEGLRFSEKVIIVVGSKNSAPNIKNPFSFEQRKEMLLSCFGEQDRKRLYIEGVRDYFYSDNIWVTDVQAKIFQYVKPTDTIGLIGNFKDQSSYYLKYFPNFEFLPIKTSQALDATEIRKSIFSCNDQWKNLVPESIKLWLEKNYIEDLSPGWKDFPPKTGYVDRINEFEFIEKYKKSWESAPYKPTFVTVDTVVVQSGHVLLVKRKFNPGKGLWALPGGFVRESERLQEASIRELKEETGIDVPKIILQNSIKGEKLFDNPNRSLRGRTVTNAYFLRLKDGELANIKGADDAEIAKWIPLMDLGAMENLCYEDHFHIINYFIGHNS